MNKEKSDFFGSSVLKWAVNLVYSQHMYVLSKLSELSAILLLGICSLCKNDYFGLFPNNVDQQGNKSERTFKILYVKPCTLKSYLPLGEKQGILWMGNQSITEPHRDKQGPHTPRQS